MSPYIEYEDDLMICQWRNETPILWWNDTLCFPYFDKPHFLFKAIKVISTMVLFYSIFSKPYTAYPKMRRFLVLSS